jgi:hypothetical protein
MSGRCSILQFVTTVDNAPAVYGHPGEQIHPRRWMEDGRPVLALHLCQEDSDNPNIIPLGWIRPRVYDLLRCPKSSSTTGMPVFVVRSDCVCIAPWVLQGGMKQIDAELGKLVGSWREKGYFQEQLKGKFKF